MDAAVFEQVYQDFREFHAYFAALFGRREARDHSGHYLQAPLNPARTIAPLCHSSSIPLL